MTIDEENDRVLKEFSIDNCRVCIDIKDWSKRAQKLAFEKSHLSSEEKGPSHSAPTIGGVTGLAVESEKEYPKECPPDALELGRSTWTFLHTMAAYYPDRPTTHQQSDMTSFIQLFSKFYPCGYCASHLRAEMEHSPPDTSSRTGLAQWFCKMHNEVNERLGKPLYDCGKVDERWRDGPSDGSCH